MTNRIKKLMFGSLSIISLFFINMTVEAASGGVTYKWQVNRSSTSKNIGTASVTSSNINASLSVELYSKASYGNSNLTRTEYGYSSNDGYAFVRTTYGTILQFIT